MWLGFALALAAGGLRAQSNLRVEGLGWIGNRAMDNRVAFLLDVAPGEPAELDATLLEDAAFLLLEQVKRRGFLRPSVIGRFATEGGEREARWEVTHSIRLAPDFVAEEAVLEIEPGPRYFYKSVAVSGVEALEAEEVERFFIPGGALFTGKADRAFTPENFERRVNRLLGALRDLGYRSAEVTKREARRDDATGAVRVEVRVAEGPLHRVGRVTVAEVGAEGARAEREPPPEMVARDADGRRPVFTPEWEREWRGRLRAEAYRDGHPDAEVTVERVDTREGGGPEAEVLRDLRFVVRPGPEVVLSGVAFRGDPETRRSMLRRRAELAEGGPLNRIAVGGARRELLGLGIYRDVDVRFEETAPGQRRAIFELTPNERRELQLLGGWGSYELARAGFRWVHRNPWGRAHRYEVDVKQSFRARRAEATYRMPSVFGTRAPVYARTGYGFREELSFDRERWGVAVGTSFGPGDSGFRWSAEYGLSREDADRDNDTGGFETLEQATVATLALRVSRDRRDSVFAPTSGHRVFASYEIAGRWLGSQANYQKLEVGGSRLHTAGRFGTVFSAGEAEENIPFNVRFFPGGENSVRGFTDGEASPLDADGDEVGAETYALGNLELEQRVTPDFSVVVFADAAVVGRDGFFEAETDLLWSVGAGLRYQTLVGPVRLEYGHNPRPREDDPSGTLHFSVGFPF